MRPSTRHETDAVLAPYLADVASVPVMTAAEELAAAQRVENAESRAWVGLLATPEGRQALARTCKDSDVDTSAPELALIEQLRARDDGRQWMAAVARAVGKTPTTREALHERGKFVKANLRLVLSIARQYIGRMPFADIVQEGNLGLLKAVDRFDYRRGLRFSTMAAWWIRFTVTRAIADKSRTIRLPVHLSDSRSAIAKATASLTGSLGREPTDDEVCASVKISRKKLAALREPAVRTVSFDACRKPSADATGDGAGYDTRERRDDLQNATCADAAEEAAIAEDRARTVRDVMADLSALEADIVHQSFGFDGAALTLKDIGARHGYSRERVRQLRVGVLAKVRRKIEQARTTEEGEH